MSYPVTRQDLMRRALERADVDASVFDVAGNGWLSTPEVRDLVVQSAARLYDIEIDILGPETLAKTFTNDFGPTIQPPPFLLPSDFYRLVSVHVCDQSADPGGPKPFANFETVEPVVEQGLAMTELLNAEPADGPFFYQLRRRRDPALFVLRDQLEVWPYPTRERFLRVSYVPTLDTDNSGADATLYDGINGWDQWVVLDVAIAILSKEESDTSHLERERDRVEQRMRTKSGKQDSFRARVPVDIKAAQLGRGEAVGYRWPR